MKAFQCLLAPILNAFADPIIIRPNGTAKLTRLEPTNTEKPSWLDGEATLSRRGGRRPIGIGSPKDTLMNVDPIDIRSASNGLIPELNKAALEILARAVKTGPAPTMVEGGEISVDVGFGSYGSPGDPARRTIAVIVIHVWPADRRKEHIVFCWKDTETNSTTTAGVYKAFQLANLFAYAYGGRGKWRLKKDFFHGLVFPLLQLPLWRIRSVKNEHYEELVSYVPNRRTPERTIEISYIESQHGYRKSFLGHDLCDRLANLLCKQLKFGKAAIKLNKHIICKEDLTITKVVPGDIKICLRAMKPHENNLLPMTSSNKLDPCYGKLPEESIRFNTKSIRYFLEKENMGTDELRIYYYDAKEKLIRDQIINSKPYLIIEALCRDRGTSKSNGYETYEKSTPLAIPPEPEKKLKQQKKDQSSSFIDQINYLALTGEKRYIVMRKKLTEITGDSTKLHPKELDLTIMTEEQATSQYDWIEKSKVTCDSLFAQDVPSNFLIKTISLLKPKKLEIRGRFQLNYILAADILKHEFIQKIDEIKIMADSSLNLGFLKTREGGGQKIWLDMDAATSAKELDQFRERAKAMKFDLISLNFRKSIEKNGTIPSKSYTDSSGHEILIEQGPTRFTLKKKIEQSKCDSSSKSPKTRKQESKKYHAMNFPTKKTIEFESSAVVRSRSKKKTSLNVDPVLATFPASGGSATVKIKIISQADSRMAFKVKSSNNEHYRVRPVYGFVEAKQETNLEISRSMGPAKKDKLVIQWAEVPAEETDAQAPFKAGAQSGEVVFPVKAE